MNDEIERLHDHQEFKRAVIEAKLEVCNKYLGYRAASETEAEAIQWLDFNRTELEQELAQLKEYV